MSKKEKTPKVKKEKKPKEKKLTDIQYIKIDMVLRMFKNNLPLYIEYEGDKQLCKTFSTHLYLHIPKAEFLSQSLGE